MNGKPGATKKSMRQRTSKIKFVTAMVILTLMFGLITGWIGSFAGFLMTFTLRHLKWTKPSGSLATTMFWLANAVGNLACAFLVQYFRTGTLFFCFILIAVTALSGLAVSSIFLADAPVWICILLTGFAMSIMWPAAFTWTEERVTSVTGYIASLFLVAGSLGGMLNPLAIGYTMDNITNIGYVYWILGEGVFLLTLFVAVSVLHWNTGTKASGKPESEGTEQNLIKKFEARYVKSKKYLENESKCVADSR